MAEKSESRARSVSRPEREASIAAAPAAAKAHGGAGPESGNFGSVLFDESSPSDSSPSLSSSFFARSSSKRPRTRRSPSNLTASASAEPPTENSASGAAGRRATFSGSDARILVGFFGFFEEEESPAAAATAAAAVVTFMRKAACWGRLLPRRGEQLKRERENRRGWFLEAGFFCFVGEKRATWSDRKRKTSSRAWF